MAQVTILLITHNLWIRFYLKKQAKIIGSICMDMLMVDATGVPLHVGDRVELLGRHVRLEEVAKACGTISYEVLTGLSPRLPRLVANGL